MKVLQIDKYFYFKGGAETVFFNTIDLLERKGHKVIPFSLKSDKNLFSEYEKYFVDWTWTFWETYGRTTEPDGT